MFFPSDEELICPVCKDIFKQPVVLSCSHSFCKDCLQTWWGGQLICMCPCCNKISPTCDPPCNLALKNLCETFVLQRITSEALCSLHSEKLKLFCQQHQEPVCVICRDSKTHSNHSFTPVDEAAKALKKELEKSLKPLQEKLKLFEQIKGNFGQTAEHINVQVQQTEGRIKEQFKKLHKFLQEEEKARLGALEIEKVQKMSMMDGKISALSRDIEALTETIKATEEELRAGDVLFLLKHQQTVKRVQQRLQLEDPQLHLRALLDQAKHLGNLTFNIWNKMKDMVSYSHVILDPNTAHAELILSEDLTSMRCGEKQKLPENPERHDVLVLGSGGFTSGIHSWNVEVRNDAYWVLGVETKGQTPTSYWQILLIDGILKAVAPPLQDKVLSVKELQRVRVQLDFVKGKLSFYDADANTHIHTFTHKFTDRLFPHFGSLNTLPLKISPTEVSVSTG
ncbi:nuclear factor 7, ovary-like [Trematomus bernacchii]|uniref:nuclear factor 7, ovary-like n=1 Tax=Trematomus bernacchii TaxID=40690 RepID=UPI00146ABFB1|nr:nuclear factor 7, ovary-like [Trematomus bernacchii]